MINRIRRLLSELGIVMPLKANTVRPSALGAGTITSLGLTAARDVSHRPAHFHSNSLTIPDLLGSVGMPIGHPSTRHEAQYITCAAYSPRQIK